MKGFTKTEQKIFKRLNTPQKIQDFLETMPVNFEETGETCHSPRLVLRRKKAHCMEGALLAATALRLHGHPPLIVHLKTALPDYNHVLAVFQENGRWGAISKTNHAALRYREPVYKTIRELVMSYFHEYFLDNGRKTLRSFSRPLNLRQFDKSNWMTAEKDVWYIDRHLDRVRHYPILTKKIIKRLRRADPIEIKAGKLTQWKRP